MKAPGGQSRRSDICTISLTDVSSLCFTLLVLIFMGLQVVTIGAFRVAVCHGHQVVPAGDREALAILQRKLNADILVSSAARMQPCNCMHVSFAELQVAAERCWTMPRLHVHLSPTPFSCFALTIQCGRSLATRTSSRHIATKIALL